MKSALALRLDKIALHLGNGEQLEDNDSKFMERVDWTDNQLRAGHRDDLIIGWLKQRYDIKKTAAYELIAAARCWRGSMAITDKKYEIYELLQYSTRALQLANADNKVLPLVKAIEARVKILALIPDETENPFKNLQQNNYYMVFPAKEDEQAIKLNLSKVSVLTPGEADALLNKVNNKMIDANAEVIESLLNGGH